MAHFIHDRDALMKACNWDRRMATLALRLIRGVDTLEILIACEGFRGVPLITLEEFKIIQEYFQKQIFLGD